MAEYNDRELLQELEALYQPQTNHRNASLVLQRGGAPDESSKLNRSREAERSDSRSRRRFSMSPWRSRSKQQDIREDFGSGRFEISGRSRSEPITTEVSVGGNKKGIWKWKPMRALSHMTMNRLSCLFSVEVIAVQGLATSMNGLRLIVTVRKKDSRDGVVQTMPARVLQGAADFDETLFIRCQLYSSGGAGTGKPLRFEPRPFLVSVVAMDAPELDFGRSTVELSALVRDSMDRNIEGIRQRQWENSLPLSGKAQGGELLVKLGFQVMEDAGVGIYSQPDLGIYNQRDLGMRATKSAMNSPAIARKQSKKSFSMTSPRTPTRLPPTILGTPSRSGQFNYEDVDDFKLDEPLSMLKPKPLTLLPKPETKAVEEAEFPEFEVVDKGVEVQHTPTPTTTKTTPTKTPPPLMTATTPRTPPMTTPTTPPMTTPTKTTPRTPPITTPMTPPMTTPTTPPMTTPTTPPKATPTKSVLTKEVVEVAKKGRETKESDMGVLERESFSSSDNTVEKEVVVDDIHHQRMTELDDIAAQIIALESMMTGEGSSEETRRKEGADWNLLDEEGEAVTREFLGLLEREDSEGSKSDGNVSAETLDDEDEGGRGREKRGKEVGRGGNESRVFIPDLGRGVSTVVKTKDGGYLAAANPFDVEVPRKETPKLALQISKMFVLKGQSSASGFELLQRMAGMGCEELGKGVLAMVGGMDELAGKTAGQIAFEGIASAVISGRNKEEEEASSSAATTVAQLKEIAVAMSAGRKERARTGLWNAGEGKAVTAEGLLGFVLQRMEGMVVEALRVEADLAEEGAPFDVFTLVGKGDPNPPLASAVAMEEWDQKEGKVGMGWVTMVVVVQPRNPVRGFEALGGALIGIVQAEGRGKGEYKVGSLHVAGMRVRGGGKRVRIGHGWDGEKERTTAAQWVLEYGLAVKAAGVRTVKAAGGSGKGENDVLWSLSSRVVADIWLKPIRNPDVRFPSSPQQQK